MTEEQKKAVHEIAAHYGVSSQCGKAVEECAELIVAIMHLKNKAPSIHEAVDRIDDLAGEIADVLIMCEQLTYFYMISEVVKDKIEFKIARQLERMEKGE